MYNLTFKAKFELVKEKTETTVLPDGRLVVHNPYVKVAYMVAPLKKGSCGCLTGDVSLWECEYVDGFLLNEKYIGSKTQSLKDAKLDAVNRIHSQILWNIDSNSDFGQPLPPLDTTLVAPIPSSASAVGGVGGDDVEFYNQVDAQNDMLHPIENDNNAPRVWTWFSQLLMTDDEEGGYASVWFSGGDWKIIAVNFTIANGKLECTKRDYWFGSLENAQTFLEGIGYNVG